MSRDRSTIAPRPGTVARRGYGTDSVRSSKGRVSRGQMTPAAQEVAAQRFAMQQNSGGLVINPFDNVQADMLPDRAGLRFPRGEQLLAMQQGRGAAQTNLYGVQPDMAQWLSVRVDAQRSGMRVSDNSQDSWARQRGFRPDTASYGGAANHFWSMEGDRLASTQESLIRGGFLSGKSVATFGRHDPGGRDHKAWLDALEMAARLNKEVYSMLDELAGTGAWDDEMKDAAGRGGPKGPKPPRRPDVQLMSAADAERMAEAIGKELIGRKLSAEEKRKVTGAIHATQRREQSAAINVAMNESGGGTSVNPTSPDTIIENTIKKNHNTEVRGAEALGAFDQLLGMIGGR